MIWYPARDDIKKGGSAAAMSDILFDYADFESVPWGVEDDDEAEMWDANKVR